MMYIYATSSFHNDVHNEELLNLKEEVKASCGAHIRRIDRFIQLALIGSHRCIKGQILDNGTGIYVASSQGPKGNISRSLQQIYKDKEPLMPLNFINMVGNAASFYVAKALNIHGANIFFTRNHFTFEEALEIALLDIDTGVSNMALVGTIDECISPLAHHRSQLRLNSNQLLGEGTHWWLISNKKLDTSPIASIIKQSIVKNDAALRCLLADIKNRYSDNAVTLAFGPGITDSDKSKLASLTSADIVIDELKNKGFYESIGGLALASYINDNEKCPSRQLLVYIDKNARDCYSLVALMKE